MVLFWDANGTDFHRLFWLLRGNQWWCNWSHNLYVRRPFAFRDLNFGFGTEVLIEILETEPDLVRNNITFYLMFSCEADLDLLVFLSAFRFCWLFPNILSCRLNAIDSQEVSAILILFLCLVIAIVPLAKGTPVSTATINLHFGCHVGK